MTPYEEGSGDKRPIRVLLVDDSAVALTVLKRMLSSAGDIDVAGTARNGREALEMVASLDPDVICTDLHMPVMDGLEFTEEVMYRFPRPILVVSVSVQEGSHNVFDLIGAGAVDVFQKPKTGLEEDYLRQAEELIGKIRILSGVHVFKRAKKRNGQPTIQGAPAVASGIGSKIVAVGASTGGPQAFSQLLGALPAGFPLPIVCVQHIGSGFIEGLVEWLRTLSPMRVEIASDGGRLMPGTAYFPRDDLHLETDGNGRFRYSPGPPLNGHRPSISVTFKSVAASYGAGAIGVLLTGMGSDGADGLKAIRDAGGYTIAQDEASSIVWGMPRQAIALDAACRVLPIREIAGALIEKAAGTRERG